MRLFANTGSGAIHRRMRLAIERAWCELTTDERRAVALITALFLLGLAIKYGWHRLT